MVDLLFIHRSTTRPFAVDPEHPITPDVHVSEGGRPTWTVGNNHSCPVSSVVVPCLLSKDDATQSRAVQELLDVLRTVPDRYRPWIQQPLMNSSSLFEFMQYATECARIRRGAVLHRGAPVTTDAVALLAP